MILIRSGLLAVAVTVTIGGWVLAPAPPQLWQVAVAVAAVAVVQLIPIRFRVGNAVLSIYWGETALIVALMLLPPTLVATAFAVGSLGAHYARWLAGRELQPALIPVKTASLTVASAAGAGVTVLVAAPYQAGLTPAVAASLGAAATAYLVVTAALAGLLYAVRERVPAMPLVVRTLRRKLPVFVGNVAVGLTVVVAAQLNPWLLLPLPAVFWLLHRTYVHRLMLTEDRRLWTRLAAATRSLNQPDENAVAVAGVRGAVDVFAVGRAEVELAEAGETPRVWRGGPTAEVVVGPDDAGAESPAPEAAGRAVHPVTTALLVGAVEVGRMRLFLPPGAGLRRAEQAALRSFGDAVAAALTNTATHQELQQLLGRSEREAQRDPLTGLLNRGAVVTRGEAALQLLPSSAQAFLLLVDLKHFREVNDTLGHAGGDEVLRVAAGRLTAGSGPDDLWARLGADEFALLVTDPPADRPAALRRAWQVVERLGAPTEIGGVPMQIEASVGVATAPAGTADMVELLRRADAAMRRARDSGEAVNQYDPVIDEGGDNRLALLAELRTALTREDELFVALQPVVDLASGEPLEVEALVRWQHPRRGLLAPADFIRVVEHSDLVSCFTEYVIDRGLAAAARWAHRGMPLPVTVNLSARCLLDPRLPGAVSSLLAKHRLPGHRLVLEITETVITSELPAIDETLSGLRALGVRLAVDDFGTGYASLTFLTKVRLDEVKIDRTFVAALDHSATAAEIVRTTVELGRELGLRVVAEGVETEEQRQLLGSFGCPAAQGYHFAAPAPTERIGETLRQLANREGLAPPT